MLSFKKMWPWALLGVIIVVYFGAFETLAFMYPDKYDTLSFTIAALGAVWPFFIFLSGGVVFGLGVHFFWAWKGNPNAGGG